MPRQADLKADKKTDFKAEEINFDADYAEDARVYKCMRICVYTYIVLQQSSFLGTD
jgi:hypothetical protein